MVEGLVYLILMFAIMFYEGFVGLWKGLCWIYSKIKNRKKKISFHLPVRSKRYEYLKAVKGHSLPQLTFEQFKTFVNLAPDKWSWAVHCDWEGNPDWKRPWLPYFKSADGKKSDIFFKSAWDFKKSMEWYKKMREEEKEHEREIKSMKATAEFLCLVQEEINNTQKRFEHTVNAQQKELSEILERLNKTKGNYPGKTEDIAAAEKAVRTGLATRGS